MARIPQVKRWKVTFYYGPLRRRAEYVDAPTKLFALWAAREQHHGCTIPDPDCIRETVGLVRRKKVPDILKSWPKALER